MCHHDLSDFQGPFLKFELANKNALDIARDGFQAQNYLSFISTFILFYLLGKAWL